MEFAGPLLEGQLLVPFLGSDYGEALQQGTVKLRRISTMAPCTPSTTSIASRSPRRATARYCAPPSIRSCGRWHSISMH